MEKQYCNGKVSFRNIEATSYIMRHHYTCNDFFLPYLIISLSLRGKLLFSNNILLDFTWSTGCHSGRNKLNHQMLSWKVSKVHYTCGKSCPAKTDKDCTEQRSHEHKHEPRAIWVYEGRASNLCFKSSRKNLKQALMCILIKKSPFLRRLPAHVPVIKPYKKRLIGI